MDGGPDIVRLTWASWPEEIPVPILVATAQVCLQEVRLEDGPTAMLRGSHRSGALAPHGCVWSVDLTHGGWGAAAVHTAPPGGVTLFVSDTRQRRYAPGRGRP